MPATSPAQLNWILSSGSQASAPAAESTARKQRERGIWLGAGVILLLLAAYLGWRTGLRQDSGSPLHVAVTLPPGKTLVYNSSEPVAISPDGSTVVYAAADENTKAQLYLRKLDSFETTPIPGTEGGETPFFSPNGEWLGFVTSDYHLKKVSLRGGGVTQVIDGNAFPGGAWTEDGTIYYVRDFTAGIYAISASGGASRQVTKTGTTPDDRAHLWPSVLSGGTGLIFTVWTGKSFNDSRIEAIEFASGRRKVLVEGGTGARYLSSGQIAYARNGTLFVVGFDAKRLEVKGTPVLLP